MRGELRVRRLEASGCGLDDALWAGCGGRFYCALRGGKACVLQNTRACARAGTSVQEQPWAGELHARGGEGQAMAVRSQGSA